MRPALAAGVFYFALVFTAGFVLGTFRTLIVAPRLGEVAAVTLELPLMLAISWIACGRLIRRFKIAPTVASRAMMGGSAFALLMAAEIALGSLVFGKSLAQIAADWMRPAGLLGLGGQACFALMPLIPRRRP